MGSPKKETCGRGHNDWVMKAKGPGRKPSRACRICENNATARARARRRAKTTVHIPSNGGRGPWVPWAPLEAALLARGLNPIECITDRTVFRWRKAGRLSLLAADVVCCEVLNVHPTAVYGSEWYEVA